MLTEGFSVPRLAWFLKPLLLLPDLFLEAPPLWVLVHMSPAQEGSQGGVGGSPKVYLLSYTIHVVTLVVVMVGGPAFALKTTVRLATLLCSS